MTTPNDKNTFTEKDTAETYKIGIDFGKALVSGENIVSSIWTITAYIGVDPSAGAVLVGSPLYGGTVASHVVAGGIAGVTYKLRAVVTTTAGNVYTGVGFLVVV